ncbi:MAG: hypothetical protein US22_C0011G0008 [candidate division TM6 bacterium GW2011_GWF2_36_6]|jgi:hypothetical protein|nr:MAG: hypothetical protein US22_C0011G0008 [candidate division TM6 bacterium GW2011_GWF2_36_6]
MTNNNLHNRETVFEGEGRAMKSFNGSKIFILVFMIFVIKNIYAEILPLDSISTDIVLTDSASKPKNKEFLIIDSTHRESFLYDPFIQILKEANWDVKYIGFDQVMDLEEQDLSPAAQAAFFIIGIEFLKSVETSPVSKKILTMLNNFCQKPNKLIGLIFPSLNINPQINLVEKFGPIFKPMGVQANELGFQVLDNTLTVSQKKPDDKKIENFVTLANAFLTRPPESRPLQYHTTLSQPHGGIGFYSPKINQLLTESSEYLKVLPVTKQYLDPVANTMPYGIYWFNPIKQNHVFISNQTILTFSGIMESFHFCPSDFSLRKEMLVGIKDMINQMPSVEALNVTSTQLQTNNAIENFGRKINRDENYPLRKTAWMELNIFEPIQLDAKLTSTQQDSQVTNQTLQQNKLIEFIMKSKLDALWISLNPNMFYSPIARKGGREKALLEAVALFTKKLKVASNSLGKSVPKILIGFEITNNIYEPNLPKPCAHDVYDNTYNDIPDPIDQNFWHNEIEVPIEKLVEQWNNPEICNGIPISGIMIDLEMYCRKTTGTFFSTMGFNNRNFNLFLHKNNLKTQQMKVTEMVQFLIDKKMATKYFDFLENQAVEIGSNLKQSFDKKINNCIIACYMPNILINWFYKGLYKGLNAAEKPVHLFSFNAEYLNHQKWFDDNKINATHSSVLLLSKITDKKSYEWIKNILNNHNGVWFNRYSRLVEPKTSDWTAVEKPQIAQDQYSDFIDYIGQVN